MTEMDFLGYTTGVLLALLAIWIYRKLTRRSYLHGYGAGTENARCLEKWQTWASSLSYYMESRPKSYLLPPEDLVVLKALDALCQQFPELKRPASPTRCHNMNNFVEDARAYLQEVSGFFERWEGVTIANAVTQELPLEK